MFLKLLIFFLTLFPGPFLMGEAYNEFPVLFQGRFRPAEAYARLWLYEMYHSPSLKSPDLPFFHTTTSSPLSFLWNLNFRGYLAYADSPLFYINSANIKHILNFPLKTDRFSYQKLHFLLTQNVLPDELNDLIQKMKVFEGITPAILEKDAYYEKFTVLKQRGTNPKEIARILEQEFPLLQRLKNAGILFPALPSRQTSKEWLPINALALKIYDPLQNELKEIGNFTAFKNQDFQKIKNAYSELKNAYSKLPDPSTLHSLQENLGKSLQEAFLVLEGLPYLTAYGKQLNYPSALQLKIEAAYMHFPWIPLLIGIYSLGILFLIAFFQRRSSSLYRYAMCIISLAILLHTALLALRCFILQRPPVSNMFETVIYVPWVASCAALILPSFKRQPLALIAACLTSIFLLIILEATHLNQSLDPVQAVLDSQFWLLVHVLMVVGSYGIFIMGAILGHFYLYLFLRNKIETPTLTLLGQQILQTMYGGTTLLITGTILGGIWAAESWGRFWDWDPKESWAFISSCFYLIWIHAYRFHRIHYFGLAVGSIIGLLAISFTWYGVNYILGTGLHSYGFGSGGEWGYYLFIFLEILFLLSVLCLQIWKKSLGRFVN